MTENNYNGSSPRVLVIADIESNAQALIDRVLKPAGIQAWTASVKSPPPDVLVVDLSQLRGDPLAGLRNQRNNGEEAPAIVLAARLPHAHLRNLFRLGVRDFLVKPYKPAELCQTIRDLGEFRSVETNTQILTRRLEAMREQVRLRSEEVRLLSEIGRVVVNLGDLEAILRRVVEAAAFITEAEEASIYLIEPETNELVLRASKHVGDRHASLKRLRVDDTVIGEIMATRKPLLHQPSLEAGPVKVQTGFMVQSLIKVPILQMNTAVGVLGVYNRLAPRHFADHHLTLLTSLAHWTGIALEHASLIRKVEDAEFESNSITAVPPSMIDGIDKAIVAMEPILDGTLGQMSNLQFQRLSVLLDHLKELQALPMAALNPSEAQEMIDLPNLLDQVVDKMRTLATRRKLDLIVEKGAPIPLFRGDSGRARRIIETLVGAAIRRTDRGRIVLEAHRFEIQKGRSDRMPLPKNIHPEDGAWVAVRITDTSSGLSPDTVRAITGNIPDPSIGQMGPGLSMGEIRMIAESMGGLLWYEHTPVSTAITFAIPIT
jgi:DNA-binding response OmpR family regulator